MVQQGKDENIEPKNLLFKSVLIFLKISKVTELVKTMAPVRKRQEQQNTDLKRQNQETDQITFQSAVLSVSA